LSKILIFNQKLPPSNHKFKSYLTGCSSGNRHLPINSKSVNIPLFDIGKIEAIAKIGDLVEEKKLTN